LTFQTRAQRGAYEQVEMWLREMFGDDVNVDPDASSFMVSVGSTVVSVAVSPWGDDDSLISSSALVVGEATISEELMRFLLRENHHRLFGAFSLGDDDSIYFGHNIVGSTCQQNELQASVLAVVQTSDDYDDPIVARFGGERAIDLLKRAD
jgi:hypothetical protein